MPKVVLGITLGVLRWPPACGLLQPPRYIIKEYIFMHTGKSQGKLVRGKGLGGDFRKLEIFLDWGKGLGVEFWLKVRGNGERQ